MQQHIGLADITALTNFTDQAVAIHLRHFDIRDQDFDRQPGLMLGEQHVQRTGGASHRLAIQLELAQRGQRLPQGHVGVVHHQDTTTAQQFALGIREQLLIELLRLLGGDFVEDFLDVENLHDGAIDLGHTRDEGPRPAAGRWRPHVAGGTLDDALDTLHLQPLARTAQFGDDQATVPAVGFATLANCPRQVDHDQGRAAQGRHPAHMRMAIGQLGQSRTRNDFLNLQQVNA
ncbi:hypothetical protein D3C84_342240 [compost metagenome]